MYKHFHGIYPRICKQYIVPIMNPMEMFVPVLTLNVMNQCQIDDDGVLEHMIDALSMSEREKVLEDRLQRES